MELVAADIGGTHARFALATLDVGGRVQHLSEPVVLRCADHANLASGWAAFGTSLGRPLPRAAAIAIAGPAQGEELRLTNNHWVIRPAQLGEDLGVDAQLVVNDFAAVAHAVAACGPGDFAHITGPDVALPDHGVISVLGPGTGLGVAALLRDGAGWQVLATEGSHGDFAAVDAVEDAILAHFRCKFGRVSSERVISGPGLADIAAAIAGMDDFALQSLPDAELWRLALAGEDRLAAAALERFCLMLGSFAGNMALAHGASAVVIGGGLGARLAGHLAHSGFAGRFTAKGRFADMMAGLPVKAILHPQPGLLGAAAAFGRTMT
ncbi:MAG: glucokinase [Sphingomonadales bacterium]